MDHRDLVQQLEIYQVAVRDRAEQAVIDGAWANLLAVAIALRGPSPAGSSKEVVAAYAVRDARIARDEAHDFDSIDQTADAWIDALNRFHHEVTVPG